MFGVRFVAVAAPGGGGGISTTLLVALIVLGMIGFAILGVINTRRDRRALQTHEDEARDELRRQLTLMADEIIVLSDHVTIAGPDTQAQFAAASSGYRSALDGAEQATTLGALARISDQLDDARWSMEATKALLDDRDIPPRPAQSAEMGGAQPAMLGSGACFFDPAHGAGTERETIQTPAGSRSVQVCRECDAALDRGRLPETREIMVGGVPTPAPHAPRSHGGGGIAVDAMSFVNRKGREITYTTPSQQRKPSASSRRLTQ